VLSRVHPGWPSSFDALQRVGQRAEQPGRGPRRDGEPPPGEVCGAAGEAVLGRQDRRLRPVGREPGDERVDRLALVRRECADVYQGRDLLVQAGLGDHRAAVGVAGQDDRAVLVVDDPPGDGGVVLQGQGRVLRDGDAVAVRSERVVHPCQPEPSTSPPCTSTTLRAPDPLLMMISFQLRQGSGMPMTLGAGGRGSLRSNDVDLAAASGATGARPEDRRARRAVRRGWSRRVWGTADADGWQRYGARGTAVHRSAC
jgi:hypothetical protein